MKMLKDLQKNVMTAGVKVGGGALSRVVANKGMNMIPVIKDHPKFHNGVNFLIGTVLMGMKGMAGEIGEGYAIVAGTDAVADFVPMIRPANSSVSGIDEMAEELADELAERLAEDVANSESAMNEDVNRGAMNDESGVNDHDD